eukprot:417368-Rhodomonas_salina.2
MLGCLCRRLTTTTRPSLDGRVPDRSQDLRLLIIEHLPHAMPAGFDAARHRLAVASSCLACVLASGLPDPQLRPASQRTANLHPPSYSKSATSGSECMQEKSQLVGTQSAINRHPPL